MGSQKEPVARIYCEMQRRPHCRWEPATLVKKDEESVTVICDGKWYTLAPERIREQRPRHYKTEEDD